MPRIAFALLFVFLPLSGPAAESGGHIGDLQDLNGLRLGILAGSSHDQAANDALDYTQFEYFDDTQSMFRALRDGEIDAVLCDTPVARFMERRDPTLRRLRGVLHIDSLAFALRYEDGDLFNRVNNAIRAFLADGTIDGLIDKWQEGPPEGMVMPKFTALPGARPIKFGVSAVSPPFAFRNEAGELVGMDIELAQLVAERLGLGLEVIDVDFGTLVSSLFYGRFDMIGSGLGVNDERRSLVLFTDAYYTSGVTALVLADR